MKLTAIAEIISGNKQDDKGKYAFSAQVLPAGDGGETISGRINLFAKKDEVSLGDVVTVTVESNKK
jgi:hypothetical protein